MTSPNPNDVVVLWDAPKIIPPEFRLYYNKETGHVLFYTGEKAEGDFIVIDAITFAAARSDLRIINGKISTVQAHAVVHKLMPHVEEGQACTETCEPNTLSYDFFPHPSWDAVPGPRNWGTNTLVFPNNAEHQGT